MKILKSFAIAAALIAAAPQFSLAADMDDAAWAKLDKITRDLGIDAIDTVPGFDAKNGEIVLTQVCNRATGCTPFTGHVTLEQYLCAQSAAGVRAGQPPSMQAQSIGCAP